MTNPMIVDTHCHLYEPPLALDIGGVLHRARMGGVQRILVPGADAGTSAEALRLASAFPGVLAAVGVHPDVADRQEVDLDALDRLIRTGNACAVGEIGLDATGPGRDLEAQLRAFRAQLGLARDHGLPALVHCRGAFGRVVEVIEALGPCGPGGILHAYNGSIELAARLAPLGYVFGVAGVATRPGSTRVRAMLASMPLDWMVLETDSPFIGTERAPRGRVEPADLVEILEALAALKGEEPGIVAEATTATAARILGMDASLECAGLPAL